MSRNDPDSLPPENFDPAIKADVMAYFRVIPNRPWAGRWFSKSRFVWVLDPETGAQVPAYREPPHSQVCLNATTDADTADPVDWSVLQEEYDYWRRRYGNQGYDRVLTNQLKEVAIRDPRYKDPYRR